MSTTTFYPLDHLSLIGLEGSDTLTFLQGQGTQDYHRLAETGPGPGAFCNAKGRVVSNVWNVPLATDPAHIMLVMHVTSAAGLQRHLAKYIPFFRGSRMVDNHLHYHGLGISGIDSREMLTDWLGEPDRGVWRHNGHFAFLLPDGRAQLWLSVDAKDYENWLEHVERHTVEPNEHWQWLDIEAGYAWVLGEQQENFLPQMLNLDLIGGISFKKGCYTGQEVVARLHYKGKAKRRLGRLFWSGGQGPEGSTLFSESGAAGEWVNWQVLGDKGVGLAVIKDTDTRSQLFLDEGRRVELNLLNSETSPDQNPSA